MHLITTLAAGVKGAENGRAEIYERGTTARAQYWPDFEGAGTPLDTDLALDSHGGAVAYVAELCNVMVKTSGGAVLREFVAGVHDDSVEVTSQSFEGESYDGGSTGPGLPTTLGNVLDLWLGYNGATNWQVATPDGSSLPISAAIAGSYGLVFNVRAFGAVGDGVADDSNAINSAIAAAATPGGIVYFPPGIYRTLGNHVLDGRVSLVGAGPSATSIVVANPSAGFGFQLTLAPAANRFHAIANMALSASGATGGSMFDVPAAGARVLFYNLHLDGTNFTLPIVDLAPNSSTTEVLCGDCVFQLASAARALSVAGSNALRRIALRDCRFITPASFTAIGVVRSATLDVQGCIFDNSATTVGTYACIETSGSPVPAWTVKGCQFLNAGGAAVVTAMNWASYGATASVAEAQNSFGSTVIAYAYIATAAARGAQIHLGSRELRSIFITDNTAAPALPIDQYGLVVLSSTNAAITFAAAKSPPDGVRGTIVVIHPNAGTVLAGAGFLNPVVTITATGLAHIWEYRVCTPASAVRMALTVDGRSLGATL